MSRVIRLFLALLFVLFAGLLLLNGVACTSTTPETILEGMAVVTQEMDEALAEPNELVFAGQVEDENGRWLNNRVVVLFKNGAEVSRATTHLQESAFSNNGPMDGVFELKIPNTYKLSDAHEYFFYPTSTPVPMTTVPGMVGNKYLGTWLGNLNPSDLRQVNVPAKQLEYALVVLPMPVDELPETYQAGNLSFQNGMLVIKPEEAETQAKIVPETAVPIVPQQSTVELVVNNNVSQIWRLEMKGYYGNRWDVWEKYVAGRGNGMSWETFKETVLVYNPHLEADGFVFYPEKTYLLPFAQ